MGFITFYFGEFSAMKKFILVSATVLTVGCLQIKAQFEQKYIMSDAEKKLLSEAEFFFDEGNYLRALPLYVKLDQQFPGSSYYAYKSGICYLYKSDEKEKAIEYLERVKKEEPNAEDLFFYLGRAYHLNYKFDEGISYFNQYLGSGKIDQDKKMATERYIQNCRNGKILVDKPVKAEIKNIGSGVNSAASEYVPAISTDESVLVFTYRGEKSTGGLQDAKFKPDPDGDYYEDIFITQKVDDQWQPPQSIGAKINTTGHDASIALSPDGQMLFIFKSSKKDGGDIYVSKLIGKEWTAPEKMDETINTKYWEGSCSLSGDGKILYFVSEKPGGKGGRDIYRSAKQADGKWGKPENLGPMINTPYNDDAPFIHPDGVSLFFSSEGHNSMGGYDIMYSTWKDNAWTEPVNMGYPINTTEDDIYYVLTADGERGYYASTRKGGQGLQDIYTVAPGFGGVKPVLALVVGVVTANDKPAGAKVNVSNAETGENVGTFQANAETGKYIVALTPGNKYKIAIEYEGVDPKIEYINIKSLDTYVQLQHDVKLYSNDYAQKNNIAISDSTNLLQAQLDMQLQKYKQTVTTLVDTAKTKTIIGLNNNQKIDTTAQQASSKKVEGLEFKVEIASVTDTNDFRLQKLEAYGKIQKKVYPDGQIRYTMGPFNTLDEAENFKKMLAEKEPEASKAFVTVFLFGQRKTVEEYKNPCQPDPSIDFAFFVGKDLNDVAIYNKLISVAGAYCLQGLSFKVQIGAYRFPQNFKYPYLKQFEPPPAEVLPYPDGITRFTMREHKTLKEAETFRQQCIAAGQKDAWITAWYNGKRMLLQELIAANFYNRAVN